MRLLANCALLLCRRSVASCRSPVRWIGGPARRATELGPSLYGPYGAAPYGLVSSGHIQRLVAPTCSELKALITSATPIGAAGFVPMRTGPRAYRAVGRFSMTARMGRESVGSAQRRRS